MYVSRLIDSTPDWLTILTEQYKIGAVIDLGDNRISMAEAMLRTGWTP